MGSILDDAKYYPTLFTLLRALHARGSRGSRAAADGVHQHLWLEQTALRRAHATLNRSMVQSESEGYTRRAERCTQLEAEAAALLAERACLGERLVLEQAALRHEAQAGRTVQAAAEGLRTELAVTAAALR